MQLLLRQLEANNTVVAFHILSRFGTNNSCTQDQYTPFDISVYTYKPACRKKKYAKKEKRQNDVQFEFEMNSQAH